jgi:hypothetical protein
MALGAAEVLHASDRDQRDTACLIEVEPVEHGPRTGIPDSDVVVVVSCGEPKRVVIIFIVLPLPGHGPCEHRTTVMKEASDEEGMGSTQRSCMECGSEMTTLLPVPCVRRLVGLRSMQPPLPWPGGPRSIIIVALPTAALPCDHAGAVEDTIA